MSEQHAPQASTDVRVAIVGVGNCASSLVQGVEYYQNADETSSVPGLMHVRFGPYHVRDVKFVAAFDVDAKKVGFDLSEAIFASENNTIKIADVPPTNVTVQRGPTLDGIGKYYADTIEVSDVDPVDPHTARDEVAARVVVDVRREREREHDGAESRGPQHAARASDRANTGERGRGAEAVLGTAHRTSTVRRRLAITLLTSRSTRTQNRAARSAAAITTIATLIAASAPSRGASIDCSVIRSRPPSRRSRSPCTDTVSRRSSRAGVDRRR